MWGTFGSHLFSSKVTFQVIRVKSKGSFWRLYNQITFFLPFHILDSRLYLLLNMFKPKISIIQFQSLEILSPLFLAGEVTQI